MAISISDNQLSDIQPEENYSPLHDLLRPTAQMLAGR